MRIPGSDGSMDTLTGLILPVPLPRSGRTLTSTGAMAGCHRARRVAGRKAAPGLLPGDVIESGGSHETWPSVSISTTTKLRAAMNGNRPWRRTPVPVGP